jgi:hypothetical protein
MSVGLLISITKNKNKQKIKRYFVFFSKKIVPDQGLVQKNYPYQLRCIISKKKKKKKPEKRIKIKNVCESKDFLISAFSIL